MLGRRRTGATGHRSTVAPGTRNGERGTGTGISINISISISISISIIK